MQLTKLPDYSLKLQGGKCLFFVEAKKPSVAGSVSPVLCVKVQDVANAITKFSSKGFFLSSATGFKKLSLSLPTLIQISTSVNVLSRVFPRFFKWVF